MTLTERFWAKVDQSAGLFGCWPWMGAVKSNGYGLISEGGRRGRTLHAHRLALAIAGGPLAPIRLALHDCDNKRCVNPAHLGPGNHSDNLREAHARGRRDAEAQRRLGASLRHRGIAAAQARRIAGAAESACADGIDQPGHGQAA